MTAKKTAPVQDDLEEDKKPAAKAKPAAKKKAAAKAAAPAAEDKAKRGRKPKAGEKEEAEEDFSDIEADLEGEVDAEAAEADAGVEAAADESVVDKPKAKPLRMKVSRAKERALMREFGLDETALTEEEVAKRRQELKTLIKMGKTRGFLTHQEINDHLPEKLVEAEILEAIVSMLNDMGIAV
jgi:RNA polymerase primary sigma factor